MSVVPGAGLFIICWKVAQRMRPSVNPGLVLALRSLHHHLLFVCNLEPPKTDRRTGRDAGLDEPAPAPAPRPRLRLRLRLRRPPRRLCARLLSRKKHPDALGDTSPFLYGI